MSTAPVVFIVIVAGGSGVRMGTAVPKQFLEIAGKPVLYHTLKAFASAVPGAQMILVLPESQMSYAQIALQHFEPRLEVSIVAGGDTRYHSVQNGLRQIDSSDPDAVVLVHDGVRPLVSARLIREAILQAATGGSAIPVISAQDSMRMLVDDGEMSLPIDRSKVRIVQTPQAFRLPVLQKAFREKYQETFTDEATVVEYSGIAVSFIQGDDENLKITTPSDLIIAEAILKARNTAATE